MANAEQQAEPNTISDLLDEIEDETLYPMWVFQKPLAGHKDFGFFMELYEPT